MMNIRDCEYIIAVDELKSFIKASQKCFISQPALSQQIKKVESELGFNIFERNNKTILTTTKGVKAVQYAKEIVLNHQNMKKITELKKDIKIAFIPTICPYILPHLLEGLNQCLPEIRFYFLEQKTDELMNNLKNGSVDIGVIAYFDYLMDSKIQYQNLYDEDFVLVLAKDSHKTSKDFPEILKNKELILLAEGNCVSDNIRDICSAYSDNSFNDFYATNIETVKNMIKMGNGVGLLPKLTCLNEQNLKIIPLERDKKRKIVLIHRKNYSEIGVIEQMSCIIQKAAKQLLNQNSRLINN